MSSPEPNPIESPAGYVPLHALSFADSSGNALTVTRNEPLPTISRPTAAPPNELTGSADSNAMAGPFVPASGWPIWLTLSGNWRGRVTVLRSTDGGRTKRPITAAGEPWAVFENNGQEVVSIETSASASYYLQLEPVSGSIVYGFAQ